jgi:endonuclease III related protein
MISLIALHDVLLAAYGPQGWWPLPGSAGRRGFDSRGYHRGDFTQPLSARGRFEIIMGAILTQNTAWRNVETALAQVRAAGIRLPPDIRSCRPARLAGLIRASGYFNQKAKKLKGVAALFAAQGASAAPSREVLLAQWGIGPETADSILLYAFHQPLFVVDAYTRRILSRIGLIGEKESYGQVQGLFHQALPPRHELFNEYHALLVEHAKRLCRASPFCDGCPIPACAWRDSRRGSPADSRR